MCKLIFARDDDAQMRLRNTLVRYEGTPVLVREASIKKCLVQHIGEDDPFEG